jgi:NADH-quinone oxidoreductase subunit E
MERRLGTRAGQTSADGAITLLPAVCLGHCDRSPCALVDQRIVGPLDEARLDVLIAELRADPERWAAERNDG